MEKKKKKSKTEYLLPAVGMITIFAAFIVIVVLAAIVTDHTRTNAITTTTEVSIEKENVLSKELDQRITEVRASLGFADEIFGIREDRFDAFQGVTDYYSFLSCKHLYYKDKDGNLYDHDGKALTVEMNSDISGFIEQGTTGISQPYFDTESGTWVIAVSVSGETNKNIVLATAVYGVSELYAGYDFNSEYSADTYVVDGDGKLVMTMRSDSDLSSLGKNAVADILSKDGLEEGIPSLIETASGDGEAHKTVYGEKNIYLISGFAVNPNVDWHTVTVLSNQTVNSKTAGFRSQALIVCGVLSACLAIVLVAFLIFVNRSKKQRDYAESFDTVANCASQTTFEIEASRIVKENPNINFALIYLDIANYKMIIPLYGFSVESQIVVSLADAVRKTIKQNEYFGRLSNGHMIILATYKDRTELVDKINHINEKLSSFEPLSKTQFTVSVIGGIYCIDKARFDLSVPDMIDKAAFAQQSIKEGMKQNYAYYDRKSQDAVIQVAEVESLMKTALAEKEFKLFLQPKYNIKHSRIDGAEALVRWERPGAGMIMPDTFIPVFEKNGFIGRIDRFMLEETCKLIAKMTLEGQRALKISVNVSRVTAEEEDFLDYYINMKNKYKIADGFIELEFTESMALESYDFLRRSIDVLRKNGFATSIDDFGQGYSSFKALKALRFDVMKLDKFFLTPGDNSERDEKLLTGVIDLAHSLGMRTIMEGVETQEMLSYLRHIDCDAIQGYIYAKPMNVDSFKEFVQQAYEKKVKHGPLAESLGLADEKL